VTRSARQTTVRFAPSPNGFLHLGHAYCALSNFMFARRHGGRFLLRIEDIDRARWRQEYEQAIYEDLEWLGVEWDAPPLRQSEHMKDYRRVLAGLQARGLLYPCTCSRGDIRAATAGRSDWPRDPDGAPLYPGTCRDRGQSGPLHATETDNAVAWRLDMSRACAEASAVAPGALVWSEYHDTDAPAIVEAEPELWGDVVLGRKDIGVSYHVAVVTDDARQGVTDVMRGMDLFHATSVHRLLQTLLGLPQPSYRHHRLITDEANAKLSKSAGTVPLRELRARGVSPAAIRRSLGFG